MWGSKQPPTNSQRCAGKLEPLGADCVPEEFPDDVSVASSAAHSQRMRPIRLPPASQQAQYARRLEIDALEAKKRFTRELLQEHHTLLENQADEISQVSEGGACGVGRLRVVHVNLNADSGEGDGNRMGEVLHVRSKKKKKKKRKKERRIKLQQKLPLTVDTSKSKSSVEVLRISLNELGWHWKEVNCLNQNVSNLKVLVSF